MDRAGLTRRPSGSLSISVPAPNLGPGPDGELLGSTQALVKSQAGPMLLSSPSTVVVIDGSL